MPSEGQILKAHGHGLPAVCKAWGVQRVVRVLLSSEKKKKSITFFHFRAFQSSGKKKKKSVRFFPFVLFSRRYGHYRHKYRDVLGQCCIYGDVVRVCALYGGLEVC